MPTLRPGPDTPGSAATRGLHRTAGLLRNGHRPCEGTHRARDHAPTAAGTRHARPAAPRRPGSRSAADQSAASKHSTGGRGPDTRSGAGAAAEKRRGSRARNARRRTCGPTLREAGRRRTSPRRPSTQRAAGPRTPDEGNQKLTTSRCEKWLRPRRQRLEDNRHRRFLRQRLLRHDLAEHPRDLIPRPTRILGGTSARTGDSRPSAAPGPQQPRPGTTPAHALGCIAERPTPSRFRTGFSEGAP